MKNLLVKTANWKFIIPPLLCSIYCITLFQTAQSEMSQICGETVEMIDVRSNYTLVEINDFFTNLKSEGRQIHQQVTGVTDMIFPFAYGLLFVLLLAWFLKKITRPDSNWIYLSLFPILLMIVDFKENFNTLNLLEKFPNLTTEMVKSAARVTSLKSLLTNMSMGLTLVLGIIYLVKWGLGRFRK